MNNRNLGEVAYNAYCDSRNWKSFNDTQLPTWAELSVRNPEIAAGWEIAGNAVASVVTENIQHGH